MTARSLLFIGPIALLFSATVGGTADAARKHSTAHEDTSTPYIHRGLNEVNLAVGIGKTNPDGAPKAMSTFAGSLAYGAFVTDFMQVGCQPAIHER